MTTKRRDFRGAVLGWTLFTTVFLWTPTNRMLFKPELANWKIGVLEGAGRSGDWWVLPVLALVALFAFYLQGRGRLRPLFHALLLGWHLALAGIVCGVVASAGLGATFQGKAWGVEIPLVILALPVLLGAASAVAFVVGEARGTLPVRRRSWTEIDYRLVAIGLALFIPAIAGYQLGDGFDLAIRIAIVTSVVQWILLAEGLEGGKQAGSPGARESSATSSTSESEGDATPAARASNQR